MLDFLAGILRDSVLLRYASWCQLQRAPRGKLLKLLRLFYKIGTHNAEVEGSSPSLTTKINGLQLLNCGMLRDFAGLRRTNLGEAAGERGFYSWSI